MQGASATEKALVELAEKPVRVLVVWEPVLPTDWTSPSTVTLRRIADRRASQFWDKKRLISHSMGEHDDDSIVWDYIAVYPSGVRWPAAGERPPKPLFEGGPVVDTLAKARAALEREFSGARP